MARDSQMVDYYRARGAEYEAGYARAELQADLRILRDFVPTFFAGRHVLEIACGTGYWTRLIGPRAASVIAIDLAPEMVDLARSRQPAEDPVAFRIGDAFDLSSVVEAADAAFAGFWWSHVRREDLHRFLIGLHRRLSPGSPVLILDTRRVAGDDWPISRIDADGNTFQNRRLASGAEYEVLKNFTTPLDVHTAIVSAGGSKPIITELTYYWTATYSVSEPG